MDQMTQGFVPNAALPGRGARVGAAGAQQARLKGAPVSKEEKSINRLNSFGGLMNLPYMAQLVLLPSMLMRFVGLKKFTGGLRTLGHGVMALETTTLANAATIPGEMARSGAFQYQIVAGEATAAKRSAGLMGAAAKADARMVGIGEKVGGWYAPVRSRLHGAYDGFAASREGGRLHQTAEKFATWRMKANSKNYQAVHGQFDDLIKKMAKHEELAGLSEHAGKSLEGMSHSAAAEHFHGLAAKAEGLLNGGLRGKAAEFATDLRKMGQQGARFAGTAASHEGAIAKGFSAILKNIKVSRMPVLMAMMTVGAVATAGAAGLTARFQNKESERVLGDMAKDIGDPKNSYLDALRKSDHSQKGRRYLSAGVSAIGDGMFAASVGSANAGMSIMISQMAVPKIGEMLVKDNPVLNAYANLQKAEKGDVQIPPADRVAQVRQLVGAVPAVIPHGGFYNKLAEPIAAKIVSEKMSLRDTMQLLSNPARFTAFASEVQAEQKAKHEAVHAANTGTSSQNTPKVKEYEDTDLNNKRPEIAFRHAEAHDRNERQDAQDDMHAQQHNAQKAAQAAAQVSANDNLQATNDAAPVAAAMLQAAPAMKVQMADAAHEGMLEDRKLAVGQSN